MPTSVVVNLRCQSKYLVAGMSPVGGGEPADGVSVTLNQAAATPATSTAMCTITVPIANDTFVIGNYYDATIVDGVAPVGASSQSASRMSPPAPRP